MIHKSACFHDLLAKYFDDSIKVNGVMAYITNAELQLIGRKKIHEMTASSMNEDIDKAITIIENLNHVLQTVQQIKIEIKKKKLALENLLTTQENNEKSRIEYDPSIINISNKTEKAQKIKEAAKSASKQTQEQLDEIRIDLDAIDTYVTNSENNRELALSYYQALKNAVPKHG